jgi:hypothetical protein
MQEFILRALQDDVDIKKESHSPRGSPAWDLAGAFG